MPYSSFYFGYQGNLQAVKIPSSGLERTQQAFRSSGTLTNGGGWVRSSVSKHYTYQLNWDFIRNADYAKISALYDYGELIHFLDPQAAASNSLPPYIAQAGDAALGGYRLVNYATTASVTAVSTIAPLILDGPQRTVRYSAITGVTRKTIWLPIPAGHTLHLRGLTTSSTNTRIQIGATLLANWVSGSVVPSTSVASPANLGVNLSISSGDDISIRWLQTKVLPTGESVVWGNWMPGLGHSGCRLDDVPSYTLYSAPQAVDYGALGLPLRETGAWE